MSDINDDRQRGFEQARILSEALPFIQRYDRETVVIKYGGHAMVDESLAAGFAKDVVLLKHLGLNPVVVHGGGPQIATMLEKLGISSSFADGLRVTTRETMEIVEMVLVGKINKTIVRAINSAGGHAVGLSGADADLMKVKKVTRTVKDPGSNIERILDLGFVGEPTEVNPDLLHSLAEADDDFIPVIAPVGVGPDSQSYNVNADTAAGAIASALDAIRLCLLTDVAGVMDKSGELIPEIKQRDVSSLIADGTVSGGMIPKVETASRAVADGVGAAVILDGRNPNALLVELFTEHGAGTLIS